MLILAAGVVLLSGAMLKGDPGKLQPLFSNGLAGIFSVAVMTPFMFVGFDVIPQAAEEIHLPPRSIGRVLLGSIAMALGWYVLIILSVGLLVPASGLDGSLVTADAAGTAWGPVGANLLVLGGVGGIITSWNAFLVGGSRAIYAMAQHDMLPAWLGRLHPRFRTPANAILAIGLLTMAAPLFGRVLLVWIVDAGSFAAVIAYLLVTVSFLRLRSRQPDMARPFRLQHGVTIGRLALVGCLGLLALYLPGSPSALLWPVEWGLVVAWFALGLLFYRLR